MNFAIFFVIFLPWFGIVHLMKCTHKTVIDDSELNSVIEDRGKRSIECLNGTPCALNCTIYDYESSPPAYKPTCEKFLFSSVPSVEFVDVGISLPLKSPLNYNITFWNINWKKVVVRSRLLSTVGGAEGAWCLALEAPHGFLPGAALAVAQQQWTSDYAGANAELELLALGGASDRYARFLYKVPSAQGGGDGVPLVAVEVSQLPWVSVVWAALPARFNVTHYLVDVNGRSARRVEGAGCVRGFCRVRVRTGLREGTAVARVRPVHALCDAAPRRRPPRCAWETPAVALSFAVPWFVWMTALLLLGLLLKFVAVVIHSLCCSAPGEAVRVLYLFDAVDPPHTRASRILGEYLREEANIECLYEAEEVPKSPFKSASLWLRGAVEGAALVLLVASPESLSPVRFSPFPDVFAEALQLLERRSGGVLVACPPYVAAHDLPPALRRWPSFRLPAHMDFLIWSIYNPRARRTPVHLLARFFFAFFFFPWGCRERRGRRLREAWREAAAAQILSERMPSTPDPSGNSLRTRGAESAASRSIAMQREFPGDLHALLGPRDEHVTA